MELMDKLTLLTNGAKYDAACTSSGAERIGGKGLGSTMMAGCCHSFSADGRCVTLLKVLLSNECIYDCKYCINRRSNEQPRISFAPEELAELTIQFYRRNYIEGLFLSSGVQFSPDHTMEQMIRALQLLRHKHNFHGYIHAKTIPGASPELVWQLGLVADRLSVNVELPSESSLQKLAPGKTRKAIFSPMAQICAGRQQNSQEMTRYRNAPAFAVAGQATQMIVGASPESDYSILRLSAAMYEKYQLKRVFYSAYIPIMVDSLLPSRETKPPLLREHRLYQADWLMRKYEFSAEEILSENSPNFNPYLDPKCNWALQNLHLFPVNINTAPREVLLRVPGMGPTSIARILVGRRCGRLGLDELKRMGVVLKRARYFIEAKDYHPSAQIKGESLIRALIDPQIFNGNVEQLTFFAPPKTIGLDTAGPQLEKPDLPNKTKVLTLPGPGEVKTVAEAAEEAVRCLAQAL